MRHMYAKLFSRIAQSSLMEQNVETRYCFMMLLAIADIEGDIIGTDVAIARAINLPLERFKTSIEALMLPDADSNSQVLEGRRVVKSDNGRGYRIVNYKEYRAIKTTEEKRAYMRDYMRERRKSLSGKDVTAVKICKNVLSDVTHAEAEAEAEAEVKAKRKPPAVAAQSDDEWLRGLQTVLAYEHLNVAAEYSRAKVWCETNRRQCTRKFFTNWLNRASANNREIAASRPVTSKPAPRVEKETEQERYHRIHFTERVAAGLPPL